jgi:hypothetical protein
MNEKKGIYTRDLDRFYDEISDIYQIHFHLIVEIVSLIKQN